jgi:hypothetical protein
MMTIGPYTSYWANLWAAVDWTLKQQSCLTVSAHFSANSDVLVYRARVSKPYLPHCLCGLNYIHYNITSCVSIASRSFNSPLCCHVYISTGLPNFGYLGSAVAQAVSRWLSHRGGPGSCQDNMWGLWWRKRHWGRFSPSTSVSSANHSTNFSIIIITRDWHNRPISGRSAEWTQLDSTSHYTN